MNFQTYDARDDLFYAVLFAAVALIAIGSLAPSFGALFEGPHIDQLLRQGVMALMFL